jgi:hypothetical protein
MRVLYTAEDSLSKNVFYFYQENYGETCILTNSDLKKLNHIQCKCIRKMVKVSFLNNRQQYLTIYHKDVQ